MKLKKALKLYRNGEISIGKAAKIASLTLNEMIQEVSAHGIKSEETIEDYRQGIDILMMNKTFQDAKKIKPKHNLSTKQMDELNEKLFGGDLIK